LSRSDGQGSLLPETGAYRIYVDDSEWKAKVTELMSRCRLTIMLGRTTTQGVLWEIQQALNIFRPEQLVFFFPSASGDREQGYQSFRTIHATVCSSLAPGEACDKLFSAIS
jgi:hypothetical protein